MQALVEQAIVSMRERYAEPLTLESIAAEVFVSPFHFCRVFSHATGMTPGRYLTAIRMFEAKRLLLTTRSTVADIVCGVGYSSVGTFTSCFARRVGMTPTQYRDPAVSASVVALAPHFTRLPSAETLHPWLGRGLGTGESSLRVRVDLPEEPATRTVFVGAFDEAVPQRGPAAHSITTGPLAGPGHEIVLDGVPEGPRTVLVASTGADGTAHHLVVGSQSCEVVADVEAEPVLVHVSPPRVLNAPVAVTLADPGPRPWSTPPSVPAARHLRAVA